MVDVLVGGMVNTIKNNQSALWLIGGSLILLSSIDLIIAKIRGVIVDERAENRQAELDYILDEIQRIEETLDPELKKQRLAEELEMLEAERDRLLNEEYGKL